MVVGGWWWWWRWKRWVVCVCVCGGGGGGGGPCQRMINSLLRGALIIGATAGRRAE